MHSSAELESLGTSMSAFRCPVSKEYQGSVCPTDKAEHELGSKRRKTVWSLSAIINFKQ